MVDADWTFDRVTANFRYIGNDHSGGAPSYAEVNEFHRWAQAKLDDEISTGDDELDITVVNATIRQTDNIITLPGNANIDANAAEHLYNGSIIQANGDTIYDGIVNYGNGDVQLQIIQNGAVIADDWWNQAGAGLNADAAQGISHRFMLLVRDAGADIDGRRLLGTSKRIGKTYSEFPINGTSRGNNVLALADADDPFNTTLEATIASWTNITNLTEGYAGIDVNDDGADEFYYSEWNRDTQSINDLYERWKWLTRDGSSSTIYGLNGELFRGITHEIAIDTPTGTFNDFEPVSWTGGTGQMLAIDSTTAGTTMWIQLMTGVPPTDNQTITGDTSTATADVNVTVTERPLPTGSFGGASTGSAILGAYGSGVEALDLTSADRVTDLAAATNNPPDFRSFSVGGLVIGEDRVIVAPWDGVSLDLEGNPAFEKDQFTTTTALTGAAETAIDVTPAIPVDTPNVGTVRVTLDDGRERRVPYTSWTGSTFTIGSTDFSGGDSAASGNETYISYLDLLATAVSHSYTAVYSGADRNLVVLVRDGAGTPIKQYIAPASFPGGTTAIRTADV